MTHINIQPQDSTPLYDQVYQGLRDAILSRRLPPGSKLPSSRDLAAQLDLSRNTVLNAFDQLIAEGYLETRPKQGTYVTNELPDGLLTVPGSSHQSMPSQRRLSANGRRLAGTKPHQTRVGNRRNIFTNGIPALDLFPFHIWARLTAKHYRYAPVSNFDETIPPAGYVPLREAVADHLRSARSVNCDAEQVLIVSGSQQGFYLTAHMLLDPGDTVWMEDPGCMGPRAAFQSCGAHLVPVPVDDDGIDVDAGRRLAPAARLAYVNPSHHYPLGVTTSLGRRHALLAWARETGAWIMEDDYDSEFRYTGRPLASLQGLDRDGSVVYVGTFSKATFPGLRLGYMVVPPDHAAAFSAARATIDKYPHIINQMVLADFITEGHFHRHLRRMRRIYNERRTACLEALDSELGGLLRLGPSDTGMHLCAYLPDDLSDRRVAVHASDMGIEVLPLSEFYIGAHPQNGLILGYTAIQPEHMREGVQILAQALDRARQEGGS